MERPAERPRFTFAPRATLRKSILAEVERMRKARKPDGEIKAYLRRMVPADRALRLAEKGVKKARERYAQ